MIDRGLIDILACPATHRPLRPLGGDTLERLNRRIQRGDVVYVNGDKVDQPLDAALVTDNNALVYVIDDDIPVLLVERGIAVRQLDDP